MRTEIIPPRSLLNRLVEARTRMARRPVEAVSIDGRSPTFFAASSVIVDADDEEAVHHLIDRGGHIARPVREPDVLPDEFRRLGLGREDLDPTGLPRTVLITFDRIEETRDVDRLLARVHRRAERVEWSSAPARALGALIAPLRADGHRVSLNVIGEPDTLPLSAPSEGALGNPLTFAWTRQASRIGMMWRLFDSVRTMSTAQSVEFIGICDSGFVVTPNPVAGSWPAATSGDIGNGLVAWNAATDSAGLPAATAASGFHGTSVASVAVAAIGNGLGAAGAGGLIARGCFFAHDFGQDAFQTAVIRCAQWGIHTVNCSWGSGVDDEDDLVDDWFDVLNWASDNGVLVLCSAGNAGSDLGTFTRYPTTVNRRGLVVGALAPNDTARTDSNYGSAVDIWAPGTGIQVVANPTTTGGGLFNQTSSATPVASGVAALVHAVNPALSVAERRQLLIDTAWAGSGRVTRGLDGYAAVWAAARHGMAEGSIGGPMERLFVNSTGRFRPIFSEGFNYPGDVDRFELDVPVLSDVTVDLEWYDDLANVEVEFEDSDQGAPANVRVSRPAAGRATIAARLSPGKHVLRLRGSGPTVVLMNGSLVPASVGPDEFESNDSFERAARLRVASLGVNGRFAQLSIFDHGPGAFDLTLHTASPAPRTEDVDFFVVDAPKEMGPLTRPEVQITYSDSPLTVNVYDKDRQLLDTHAAVRTARIGIAKGTRVYLEVRGATHTRYGLWVGGGFDNREFGLRYPQVLPFGSWWDDIHPNWSPLHEIERGLVIGREHISDGVLVIGAAPGGDFPAGVRLALLNEAGETVRQAESSGAKAVFDLGGIEPGAYVLRALTDAAAPVQDAAALAGLVQMPPVWR